jgi:hypothetical protein
MMGTSWVVGLRGRVWRHLGACLPALLVMMLGVAGCDQLSKPPVPEWPGPHAPYPFPDDVPHRTK